MISLKHAISLVLKEAQALEPIILPIARAQGFVLAKSVIARYDAPSFDNSSVDGYGVKIKDLAVAKTAGLALAQTIHAGEMTRKQLRVGQAFKIMTGAFVPKGVEAIVMREHVLENNGRITLARTALPGQNIRKRGSEFRRGQTILKRGTPITPPVLGLLASQGIQKISVIRKPTVGLLITGDELISQSAKAGTSQIYDSNSPMLLAMCAELGIIGIKVVRTKDRASQIRRAIDRLLSNDILIAVGGVSVGDRDLVKDQLELAGVKRIFWGIDMKPGKPNYFGVRKSNGRKTLVFGLPGNPVSAAVSFKKLIEPAIWELQRTSPRALSLHATLTESLRPDKSRLEFLRGRMTSTDGVLFVRHVRGQGSGMLGGLAEANVLIAVPSGDKEIPEGESVEVLPLYW